MPRSPVLMPRAEQRHVTTFGPHTADSAQLSLTEPGQLNKNGDKTWHRPPLCDRCAATVSPAAAPHVALPSKESDRRLSLALPRNCALWRHVCDFLPTVKIQNFTTVSPVTVFSNSIPNCITCKCIPKCITCKCIPHPHPIDRNSSMPGVVRLGLSSRYGKRPYFATLRTLLGAERRERDVAVSPRSGRNSPERPGGTTLRLSSPTAGRIGSHTFPSRPEVTVCMAYAFYNTVHMLRSIIFLIC